MLFSVHVVFVLCMKSGFFASVNSVNSRVISVFVSDVFLLAFLLCLYHVHVCVFNFVYCQLSNDNKFSHAI